MKIYQRGQLLFELVAALGLVALILVTVVSLASVSVSNTDFSKNNALATKHSQDAIEWLRKVRDTNWTTFSGKSTTNPGSVYCITNFTAANPWTPGTCGSLQVISGTIFQREVKLIGSDTDTTAGIDTILAEVVTRWTDSKGIHEAKASTLFTIWK